MLVALPDDAQPRERQQVVDLVERVAERDHACGEPAGGDRLGRRAELLAQAADDPVDHRRVAEDHPGADRVDGRLADQRARLDEVDLRQRRGAVAQRLERDLDAREDHAAEVLALGRDDVVRDGGAEVDDHARPAELLVAGDRVHEPVGPDLARVVVADRHPGPQPRARRPASRGRGSAAPSSVHSGRSCGTVEDTIEASSRRTSPRAARAGCAAPRRARRPSTGARSRTASARPARCRRTCRCGSACCRRRRRAASAAARYAPAR